MNIYILDTESPESWGNEAYNGMEISEEELIRLSEEWETPVTDLMKDIYVIDSDGHTKLSTIMKMLTLPIDAVSIYNSYFKRIETIDPSEAEIMYGNQYIDTFSISEDNEETVLEIALVISNL